ncbi:hypothetical protein BB558_000817 [Smittium angustum]|uniref:Uncharacterized protein n=1 Tax=Smittium angustum TaxID=133377 RepID=A0A2U1JDC9_SMIAN|nr:hypothetical protein BB558_007300 [Smittium angustum]PWA03025.1 hypothetical protein BB558_000817 [Smittium angustum]
MQKRKSTKPVALPIKKLTPALKRQSEEEKKKIEAEEAAKVYEEFVAAFEKDETEPKTFIKAGTTFQGYFKL